MANSERLWRGKWIDDDDSFRQMWRDYRCVDDRDHMIVVKNNHDGDIQEDICARCGFVIERHDEGVLVLGIQPLDALFDDLDMVQRYCETLEEYRRSWDEGRDFIEKGRQLRKLASQFGKGYSPIPV